LNDKIKNYKNFNKKEKGKKNEKKKDQIEISIIPIKKTKIINMI
jgi:hypothetical protein